MVSMVAQRGKELSIKAKRKTQICTNTENHQQSQVIHKREKEKISQKNYTAYPEAGCKSTVQRILREDLKLKAIKIKRRVKLTDKQKDH